MDLLTILVFIVIKYFYIIAFKTFNVTGEEINFAMKNESMDIECKIDSSKAFCGKRYVPADQRSDDCKVAIRVTKKGEGNWQCDIDSEDKGIENVKNTLVRVGEKVAAIQKNILADYGASVTLECATITGPKSMKYCRFEPPYNAYGTTPITIYSRVNKTSLLINRFYYPSNKSLDRGDCAVTIHDLNKEDHGLWTCGAGLNDGKEYIDYIELDVIGTMTKKLLVGIVVGSIVLTVCLSLVVMKLLWPFITTLRHVQPQEPGHELQNMEQSWRIPREEEPNPA